ncbi:MAG: glycosyltransferase family 92 protein [Acidobacteriaceae bacterium]|jgi:hypothetical protein
MGLYFTIREKLRFNPIVNATIYLGQSLYCSHFGRLVHDSRMARKSKGQLEGVALCTRFRDEARYLPEWLEYYIAAGIDHFFLYNNFSNDGYLDAIGPWLNSGQVTLVDWPRAPASPGAEEDCVRRVLGRFQWVGFVDADEFVVVRNGQSIGEFLDGFPMAPGVGLHWRMFGSSMHKKRPGEPVILAYRHRSPAARQPIKSFIRPERAAQCRNPHSWFYSPIGTAVDEHHRRLFGSLDARPTADLAWINHYFCKSQEDYLEKTSRKPTSDPTTMRFEHRRPERVINEFRKNNEVFDSCAVDYYRARCEAIGRRPILLEGLIAERTGG